MNPSACYRFLFTGPIFNSHSCHPFHSETSKLANWPNNLCHTSIMRGQIKAIVWSALILCLFQASGGVPVITEETTPAPATGDAPATEAGSAAASDATTLADSLGDATTGSSDSSATTTTKQALILPNYVTDADRAEWAKSDSSSSKGLGGLKFGSFGGNGSNNKFPFSILSDLLGGKSGNGNSGFKFPFGGSNSGNGNGKFLGLGRK